MKRDLFASWWWLVWGLWMGAGSGLAQEIQIRKEVLWQPGTGRPIPIALSGFEGEAASVLRFDLEVAGFQVTGTDTALFELKGGRSGGGLEGALLDRESQVTLWARVYNGGTLRQQAHAMADDVVLAVTGRPGIAQTRIAFKVESGGTSEIYVSDYDGYGARAVTQDRSLVAAPCWVPGRLVLYYTSYKSGNPDILRHDLTTGRREVVAGASRTEHQCGHFRGWASDGHDSEQGWCDGVVRGARGRRRVEAADLQPGGRVLAHVVAGWAMDLLCDATERASRVGADFAGGRVGAADRDGRGGESVRTGLVSGRQMDCVYGTDGRIRDLRGAGGGGCGDGIGERGRIRVGRRIPGPWCSRAGWGVGRSCLCLTWPRGRSRMSRGFRAMARNRVGRGRWASGRSQRT